MIRLLHLGDLHPNASATLAGKLAIDPETSQNQALTDLDLSLAAVLRSATNPARPCHLAVIAGDLFDSHKPHPNEIRVIRRFLTPLAAAMPVVVIPGNHDMSQNPRDATALEAIKGLPGLHIVERPDVLMLAVDGQAVQVACLPYPQKGKLLTQDATLGLSPEAVMARINEGLAAIVRHFAAERSPHTLNLLVAHGSVRNATVGEQPRSLDHDILIPADDFGAFDYVALGHIHRAQAVAANAHYCGSLTRQGFGEETETKGWHVVELGSDELRIRQVLNPHTRTYCTITPAMLQEHDYPDGLQAGICWRFKGSLTDQEARALQPTLDRLAASTPWFQQTIEYVGETRARDATMTTVLTTEAALLRALEGKVDEQKIPALLELHRALDQLGN